MSITVALLLVWISIAAVVEVVGELLAGRRGPGGFPGALASRRARVAAWGKLTLVALPTHAPWLNFAEKVWRSLNQEVLHVHPWTNAWEQFQAAVQVWLDQWADGSTDLLPPSAILPVRELLGGSLTAPTFLPECMSHAETINNHRNRSRRLPGV
jgi:hypothetical protein